MEMMKAIGEYHFEGFDKNGVKVIDRTFHNILTQEFFTRVFKFLNQEISAPEVDALNLTHMATGTGTATPTKADTALGAEVFRKAISSKTYSANKFTCKLSLDTSESNFTITEIGTFAKATDTAGSGTLISRALVNIPKTSAIKYLVTYTIICQ